MDVQALIAAEMKKKKDDAKPRVILAKVETAPAFSKSDNNVFRVRGTNVETGEPVFLIAVKAAAGQAVPKPGDIIRADKATPDGAMRVEGAANPISQFRAKYFHTYENGFCLNAVMQPMPVRTTADKMVSAQVFAYDTKASGRVVNGSEIQSHLVEALVRELMPWTSTAKTAITHDVGGKSVWGEGASHGIAPVAVVRFMGNSFKVFGVGGLFKNIENKADGLRFPATQEVRALVEKNPGVQNLLTTIAGLKAKGLTDDQLKTVDVSVLPGLALSVGRDKITFSQKKNQEYFDVPDIYKVHDKASGTSFNGHRESFIHLKQTRIGRLNVVDTAPAPGSRLSPQLPQFEVELEVARQRTAQSAGATSTSQPATPQKTREQALAVNDFDEPTPMQQVSESSKAPVPAHEQPVQSHSQPAAASEQGYDVAAFEDEEYDFSGLAEDMGIIEQLNSGLEETDLTDLFEQAEKHSLARTPRMG